MVDCLFSSLLLSNFVINHDNSDHEQPQDTIGCKNLGSPEGKTFPGGNNKNFPDQLAVTIETFDLQKSSSRQLTTVHRHDVS